MQIAKTRSHIRNAATSAVQALNCKTIAVFGATGGVGLECVYQALSEGYKVRALARNPSRVVVPPGSGGAARAGQPLSSPDLTVIAGDVTKAEDVAKVLEGGVDGVVVALGGRTSEVGETMLTDGTRNVIKSMRDSSVSRVAIVTSIGAGDSYDQAPLAFKLFMWTILKNAFVDKNNQEGLFLTGPGSDLDWTIVRPGGLNLNPPTGQYKVLEGKEMAGSIARADVAAFCLRSVGADSERFRRRAVCIS